MKKAKSSEPLVRISKRTDISPKLSVGVRVIAIAAAFIVCALVITAITNGRAMPWDVYSQMLKGAFGTVRRVKITLRDTCALLCLGLALAPAFKMRFWNIGAEGQALIGALASTVIIKLCPGLPWWLMLLVMLVDSVVAGALWGVIPAAFKATIGANETLFTLMMNYVAYQLVNVVCIFWEKQKGSSDIGVFDRGTLPKLFGVDYGISIVVILLLTAIIYVYMKYSKQGYEISVVGESENTARYIGINVKKVIIRTMMISGGLCGLAGFLLVSGTHHTLNTGIVGGNGFTAIIVAWLAHLNPIFMLLTSFFVSFLDIGTAQIATSCQLNTYASDIVVGIALFFILGCEFFINYKVVFRNSKKAKEAA